VIVKVRGEHAIDPLSILKNPTRSEQAERCDLAEFVFAIELVDGEQLSGPGVGTVLGDIVEIDGDDRQIEIGRAGQDFQRLSGRRIIVHIDGDEAERILGRQRGEKRGNSLFDITDNQLGERRKRGLQAGDIHGKVAFLEGFGQVAIIDRRRHPAAGIEAVNTEVNSGRAPGLIGNAAHIEETGAGRHAELDNGNRAEAVATRALGREEHRERILLSNDEVKIDLCAIGAEEGDKSGEEVQMKGLRTAFNEYLSELTGVSQPPNYVHLTS
jgi:hypothetical protein